MKSSVLLSENIRIALHAIRSNLLRTILTVMIIAIGIMALVGILTAIEAIKASISKEFTFMGANTFSIRGKGLSRHEEEQSRRRNYSYINFYQAKEFKEKFNFPAIVSLSYEATGTGTLKYGSVKTNPNIAVRGIDENYVLTSGFEIEQGRNMNEEDVRSAKMVTLIGPAIVSKLFPDVDPIGKEIWIGSGKYLVIGVLKTKGSSLGINSDQICFIPHTNARIYFSRPEISFTVQVMANSPQLIDVAVNEAEGIFRTVRKLSAWDENDFEIEKSDNLVNILLGNIRNITLVATIIGLITLCGAAVGLMNIMLVAVAERTREIGIRKAIGASSGTVKRQFLIESIIIGQIGGALGIILGILAGNVVSKMIGNAFVVPWGWIIMGVLLCFGVGILSGYYPAVRASRLDPIEALRYE
ncbi:MAG: ABC transporter permease [Bacteroidota bacterium]|nr:ABC transporter permease [Bacteroidota bacterium]